MSETSKHARRTVARHGQLSSPGPVRQLVRLVAVAVAVVLVSGAGVVAYAYNDLFTNTFAADATVLDGQDTDPPDIGALDNEGVNILFAGIDACEEEYKELFPGRCDQDVDYDASTEEASSRNDVNMLVHISPEPRRITVVSFPRDLMTSAPECESASGVVSPAQDYIALNAAFSRGGLNCVAQTITEISGQTIDYAATITWGGVVEITNAIGGVDVCVGGDGIYDDHTGLALEPGQHTLAGVEALEFLRTRHGVGDGSDLSRISNQQVYMSALARKLVSDEVLTNPATLLTLARTTLSNVDPSSSLTNPVTLVQIAMAGSSVALEDYVFVQYPTGADPYDSNKVAPNYEAAELLWSALEQNEAINLTGDTGNGADLETPAPEETEAAETPTPEPSESASVDLDISGTDASQVTCSDGQGQLGG